jgi:DNA-binding transcriptional regulator YiaG
MNGIKCIRNLLGLSQEAFGKRVGKTQANVSLYEVAGQAVPPPVAQRVIELCAEEGYVCTFNDVYSDAPKLKRIKQAA